MTSAAVHPLPLFAAGFDWLEAILPILFVGFWIVSQVFAVLRRVAGGPARPPVVGQPGRPRDGAGAPPPEAERSELERQIAEFLRDVQRDPRVAGQPGKERQPEKGKPPRRAVEPQRRPPTPAVKEPRPTPAKTAVAGIPAPAQRPMSGLGTGPTDVARHVQDAFAHELAHLHSGLEARDAEAGGRETARREAVGTTPYDLVRTLRDPVTLRQAVLLREILERPVERW